MVIPVKIISESEIQKVIPDFDSEYAQTNPSEFIQMLSELGMNISKPVEQQYLIHRNVFNEVVCCNRWVGLEKIDEQWLNSGYASRDAKLAASDSRLVADLNPLKHIDF